MKKSIAEPSFIDKAALFIVDKRKAFYLIFAIAVFYFATCIPKVQVENDITAYLPESTETKIGLDLMDREFTAYDSFYFMISNISYDKADKLAEQVREVDGIKSVEFSNDDEHFKNSSALFNIVLNSGLENEREIAIEEEVKGMFPDYDCYIYSDSIDTASRDLAGEMRNIIICVVFIVVLILLFTSKSFMDVPVFLIVFIVAAVLNMGSNYMLGTISFISNSVAIVLQLALAIDYAIILSHRFAEEKENKNAHDAIAAALSKAIIEISSSSLTTIAGLAALMTMQMGIGRDLGIVLCKGIFCSLITVFLLMPGLLYMFSNAIDKTVHRNYIPDISGFGRFVMGTRKVLPIFFAVIIVVSIVLSSLCQFAFDESSVSGVRVSQSRADKNKIRNTFDAGGQLAVIIPKGNYDKEKKILQDVGEFDGISSALGLANVDAGGGYTLTDKVTPRQFAELMNIDIETVHVLFQAYGASVSQYAPIFRDVDSYTVSIIDILMFVHEQMDYGVIDLGSKTDTINEVYDKVTDARDQLEGDEYSRLVFTYTGDNESDKVIELHDKIRETVSEYYDDPILVSNAIAALDLKSSFSGDNRKINFFTIISVLLILLVTFRSSSVPVLLVLTIQGSIWINFSFPYLMHEKLYFLGYLVVSSIQMGATIDYAIVFTNRYLEQKDKIGKQAAAIDAINGAFPTILTSGLILMIAGFLIGIISTNPIISGLGICLGRGTLISILLIMILLPQIMIVFDKLVEKGGFVIKTKEKKEHSGAVLVNGKINGYVNGYITGTVHGVIKGDVKAVVDNMTEIPPEKLKRGEKNDKK